MVDTVRSARDEESRKRDDVALYQMQQQIDELRRQLRDALARQQWLEDLYKNTEGKVVQLQLVQERHTQDVSQTLQVRQIEEGRLKQQIAEIATRVEEPMKPIRDLRAQMGELLDSRRQDRERVGNEGREIEGVQTQIRQLTSQIGLVADGLRQLRDQVQELDSVNNETRQEIGRVAETHRLEEQRLRRQGVELQELVESLRAQFVEISTRNIRVDEVRRALMEHIEALQGLMTERAEQEVRLTQALQRVEKQVIENHVVVQERLEVVRSQYATDLTDVRQTGDQRMDRYVTRFQQIEDRLRALDSRIGDLLPQFDILRRQDEEIGETVDLLEERHLRDELGSIEAQIEAMRQRRAKKQAAVAAKAALVRNVRDARPHTGPPIDGPPVEE
jgi:chromosome segregation ATPase